MVYIAPWPVLNSSETLEDRLPKNSDGKLIGGGCAGGCSGRMNCISDGKGTGWASLTGQFLYQSPNEPHAETASSSWAIVGIWWLLLVPGGCWGSELSTLGRSPKGVGVTTVNISSCRRSAFGIWHKCESYLLRSPFQQRGSSVLSSSKSRATTLLS